MIHAYLDLKQILAAGGKIGPAPNTTGGKNVAIGNLSINVPGNEDLYIYSNSNILQYALPSEVNPDWVMSYSFHDNICPHLTPKRQIGEYVLGTASAVMSTTFGKEKYYCLQLSGKKLKDVQGLYRLICEGKIWPVGDYEAEMSPPPCRHIRQLLRELWAIIRRDVSDVSLKLHNAL